MANDVRVDVELDTKKAEQEAEGFKSKMKGVFGDISKIAAGVALGQGITSAAGFLKDAAQAAAEDEAATRRLDQALRNIGGAFDENKAKIDARIEAGSKLAFSDDQVRDSFQTLLAATGDVDEALRRQALAMDFARGAGIPLEQASKLLGKVTEENVEVFKRMGITIGEGATEAEAFAVIQGKFAGQSEAYAKSTAGQFEQTKIRMGELKEQIGTALLPAMAAIGDVLVNDVIPKLEQFAGYWQENIQPKVEEFITWFKTNVMPVVKRELEKFQQYYETDIKPALDNIKTAIQGVVTFLKEHWGQIEPFVRPIFIAIELAFKTMTTAIGILIDLLGGDWEGAWNKMKDLAGEVLDAVLALFGAAKDQISVIAGLMGDAFSGFAGAVESAMRKAVGFIISLINTAIDAYNKLPGVGDIQKIGEAAAAASSQFGAPIPGGENSQLPGREVFGQTMGGGSGGGALLVGPSAFIPQGAQHAQIQIHVENLYANTEEKGKQAGGDLAYAIAAAGVG